MKKFKEQVLLRLLKKYQGSSLSTGKNQRKISIKIKLEKDSVLKKFFDPKEVKNMPIYLSQLRELEELGFIKQIFEYSSLEAIELNVDKVNEIYSYLNIQNPDDKFEQILEYLNTKKYDSFLNDFVKSLINQIENRGNNSLYFENIDELKILLTALEHLINLNEETMERDFSVQYLHDSKVFTSIRNKVIKVLKEFDPTCPKDLIDEDILSYYNIVKNSTYAMIKRGLTIKIRNQIINLEDLGYEMSLSDQMIKELEILDYKFHRVVTVENLTTFYKVDWDAIIIYLGGFHNHTKRMLLTKIHDKFPDLLYYHYGDIDAGGFYIFNDLKEKTGIDFKPVSMGVRELEENKDKLKSLTENDVIRLTKMLDDSRFSIFKETIEYMLRNNVKLEQEILD